jgi:hypothetical protein
VIKVAGTAVFNLTLPSQLDDPFSEWAMLGYGDRNNLEKWKHWSTLAEVVQDPIFVFNLV